MVVKTTDSNLLEAISEFPLILITSLNYCHDEDTYLEKIKTACRAGVRLILFREPSLERKREIPLIQKVSKITKSFNGIFILNAIHAHVDTSLFSIDGIHYPERVRSLHKVTTRKKLIIGRSVHSLSTTCLAQEKSSDYLLVSNIFETMSKRGSSGKGLPFLREIASKSNVPVFALGGITPKNANACILNGAHGVATLSYFMKTNNITEAVNQFKKEMCST